LRIDLIRHGEALAVAVGVSDEARPLSARGAADVERLGRRLGAGWRPDQVFASPLRRARDSAVLLLRSAGIEIPIRTMHELDPLVGTSEDVIEALADAGTAGHLVLVGHQPLLGRLAYVLSGTEAPFAPAAIATLEGRESIAPGAFHIVSVLAPGADY
jgi:phosphohistidine phosphatase SixA